MSYQQSTEFAAQLAVIVQQLSDAAELLHRTQPGDARYLAVAAGEVAIVVKRMAPDIFTPGVGF